MGLFGDYLGSVLGGTKKPSVPVWTDINLADEQQKAIKANLDALPNAESLASSTNAFNEEQILKMLQSAIPNYDQLSKSASNDLISLIKGELPQGVSDQVQNSAAARALGSGYAGSGMSRNLVARDLGLTSLQTIQQGLSSAEQWIRNMDALFAPGMLNVTSMFVSPQQMFSDTMANQENKWGVQWLKNQIKAMPDPQMEALGQFIGGIGDAAASYFVGAKATQRSASNSSGGMGVGGMGSEPGLGYSTTSFSSGEGTSGYTNSGTGYALDTSGTMDLGNIGAGAGGAGGCCFIFLESYNGILPWWVRQCRDEYYVKYPTVAVGYKKMASWIVPIMRKSKWVRNLVNYFMVIPMTKYGGWLKGVEGYKHFRHYWVYKEFWFTVWKMLGKK